MTTKVTIAVEPNEEHKVEVRESYGNDFYGSSYIIQAGESLVLYIYDGKELLITERDKDYELRSISKEI